MDDRVINWLLEDAHPALKYRTLTELLEKPQNSGDVRSTYEKVLEQKEIQRIFDAMDENGR